MNIVYIHLATLALTAIAIFYSDHLAFQYFRGRKQLLPRKTIVWLHNIVWAGLIGMIVSGFFLFLPMREYLLTETAFYIKMSFVLVLMLNAWVIGNVSHVASTRPFVGLSRDEKHLLMTSGVISFSCWVGAAIIGYFFL